MVDSYKNGYHNTYASSDGSRRTILVLRTHCQGSGVVRAIVPRTAVHGLRCVWRAVKPLEAQERPSESTNIMKAEHAMKAARHTGVQGAECFGEGQ